MRTTLLILVLLLILLSTYLGYERGFDDGNKRAVTDTIEVVVFKRDTIQITAPAKVEYRNKLKEVRIYDTIQKMDTVIQVYPFTASLDTIVNDTISLDYIYPENIFNLEVRARLDSIIQTQYVEGKTVVNKDNFYYGLGLGVGGSLLVTLLILMAVK